MEKQVYKEKWKEFLKWFFRKENPHVIFEKTTKSTFYNGLILDSVFCLIYLVLPVLFSIMGTLTNNENSSVLFIVNFALLSLAYPLGLLIYWKYNHISLLRNGGIGFFIGIFTFNLIIPIIKIILDKTIANLTVVHMTATIIEDLFKVFSLIFLFKFAKPVRKDIKFVITKRTLGLFVIAIIFVSLYFLGQPLFDYLNNLISSPYSKNDSSIILNLKKSDFFSYWNMIFFLIITPIFYEYLFRYSIMIIMRTNMMKIFVPTMFFLVGKLMLNPSTNDLEHFFYYFWWSLILTLLVYFKRNLTYSFLTSSIISQINVIRILI